MGGGDLSRVYACDYALHDSSPGETIADTFDFIHSSQRCLAAGTDMAVAIVDKVSDEYIGNCGVHSLNKTLPSVGLWIKASAQGKGYGREVIGGLLDWVRTNYTFPNVEYVVDRENHASRRIVESFGGRFVGQHFRDIPGKPTLDFLEYLIPLR